MAFNKLPTATLTSLPLQDAICLGGCSLIWLLSPFLPQEAICQQYLSE